MNRAGLAHSIAVIAALEAIVLTSVAWVVNLRGGPRLGLEAGAVAIFLPLGLLVLFGMWLVLRFILLRRLAWNALLAVAAALALGYLVVAASCGPTACFTASPNRYMGWFLVLGAASAALLHHLVLVAFNKKNPNGS
jgi:hypothetical protein